MGLVKSHHSQQQEAARRKHPRPAARDDGHHTCYCTVSHHYLANREKLPLESTEMSFFT